MDSVFAFRVDMTRFLFASLCSSEENSDAKGIDGNVKQEYSAVTNGKVSWKGKVSRERTAIGL